MKPVASPDGVRVALSAGELGVRQIKMKSIFLTNLRRPEILKSAISSILPGQKEPWILASTAGDPIAYFHIEKEDTKPSIQADISGRHYEKEKIVIDTLIEIAGLVGGTIKNENH